MPSRLSNAILAAMRAIQPVVHQMDIFAQRDAQNTLTKLLNPARGTRFFSTAVGDVPGSWVLPAASRPASEGRVVLFCHGGAYMAGTLQYAKVAGSKIAAAAGLPVFAFDYRLSPEHPFPAALEDALACYRYLLGEGYKPEHIAFCGESAGGNLCLTLALAARQAGLPLPGGVMCISPWTDLTASGPSYAENAQVDPTLNTPSLLEAARLYVGEHDPKDPLISPAFGDYTGFPPTLIHVSTVEILKSDAEAVHAAILRDGGRSTLHLWEGMPHVFQIYPFPEAKEALAEIGAFLRAQVGERPA